MVRHTSGGADPGLGHGGVARPRRRRLGRLARALTRTREHEILEALVAQVSTTQEGVDVAIGVAEGRLATREARARMVDIEHDGDEHRRRVVEILSRSFTTPIDREDLFRLSRSIDDVLDNIRDFTREYDLLQHRPDHLLMEVLQGVASAVEDLRTAVTRLGERRASGTRHALQVRKNDIRARYQSAIAALLTRPMSTELLKRRELLRRLDVVGLRLGEAADALADGAVKRSQ